MTQIEPAPLAGEGFVDLPERLRRAAADRPDHPALISDGQTRTAKELAEAMQRAAALLAADGVRPGDVVASVAGVTAEHVILYLGALAAGAAMAPLPTGAHPDALSRMAENSGARLLYTDAPSLQAAAGLSRHEVRPLDDLSRLIEVIDPAPAVVISPTDLFDIIYSSGTTGAPKGIEHDACFRHRQLRRLERFDYGRDSVALVSTPIYSNTTLAALLPALGLGGAVVLMRRFDEVGFLRLAERHRVTHAMLVPVQYARLLAHPDFDRFDLSSFRVKLSTSAHLPPPVVRAALKRWPGRLVNIYGMTEGGVSAILDCGAHPDKLHSVGRPGEGADIRILDPDGRDLPPGDVGEIVGRSPTIMRGYRGDPAGTADALWFSPEGHAFIRSGDLGRLDADGFLTILDRQKDVIISGGFNVYACDLEAALLEHPAVAEAAVIGVPSERWGETPVGLVVPRPGAAADPARLCDWANARLGRMQGLSAVELCEALPRSQIGKVIKRELRARYLAPV